MPLGAWKRILFANLTLAASLAATGCAGTAGRSRQADSSRREDASPADYARSDDERSPQSYESASLRDSFEQDYEVRDSRLNPYASQSYPPDLSQFDPQSSLERDMRILRESEQRQEQMLREMRSKPDVSPDALQRQEDMIKATRQKINVYDLALGQQDLNPLPSRDAMDSRFDEMTNRERISAMSAPDGHEFPPRSEVRLPRSGFTDQTEHPPVQSRRPVPVERPAEGYGRNGGNGQPVGSGRPGGFSQSGQSLPVGRVGTIREEPDQETERVVYDPRRDGDFSLFAFSNTSGEVPSMGDDSSLGAGGDERRVIIPPGSIAPFPVPSSLTPPVAPSPNQKPFAGAPVGRSKYPSKKADSLPEDWSPPADLFSQSGAPDEVLAHPGLFSSDGREEKSDWPSDAPSLRIRQREALERGGSGDGERKGGQSVRPPSSGRLQGGGPVEVQIHMEPPSVVVQPSPAEAGESARFESRSLRPEAGVKKGAGEKPVITMPSSSPESKQPRPMDARREPEKRNEEEEVEEVFVPDMIFSRR